MKQNIFAHLAPELPHVPLAPPLASWLEKYNKRRSLIRQGDSSFSVAVTRENMARFTRGLQREKPEEILVIERVYSFAGAVVPLRYYHPEPARALPVMVFLHGGGHVAGDLGQYDIICRKLALATRHLVIGVGYRLAPEYPYPAGLDDAGEVLHRYPQLLHSEGLPFSRSLRLCGESCGGAMAATIAHRRIAGNRLDGLVLVYPSLDYSLSQPSVRRLGRGYLLEQEMIEWCFSLYFQNNEDRRTASPLFMPVPDYFPRTCLISAGFCPLRDEAFSYAEKLRQNGKDVAHYHFGDMVHSFLHLEKLAQKECRDFYLLLHQFFASS